MKKIIGIIIFFCLLVVVVPKLKTFALNQYGIQTKAIIFKYGLGDFEKSANPNGINLDLGDIGYNYRIKGIEYYNIEPLSVEYIYFNSNGKKPIGDSILIEYLEIFPSVSRFAVK